MKLTTATLKKYSKKTIKQLDAELWRVFSLWIRQKDADDNGVVRCVTCGAFRQWRSVDAGHFISRRHLATKFDERNVHPQCKQCNGFKAGEQFKMSQYINRKFGFGMAEKLERLSKQPVKWDRFDYILKIEHYKELLKKHKFLTR